MNFRAASLRIIPALSLALFHPACALAQYPNDPALYELSPAGTQLHVELQLGDGKRTTYHVGEVIPGRLTYFTREHSRVWVSYDRCDGPEDYPRPIAPVTMSSRRADYLPTICSINGAGGFADLSTTPVVNKFILNYEYRLDTAGTFPMSWSGKYLGQQVTSNTVNLTLLPRDPAWERWQLLTANLKINGPDAGVDEGCKMLLYLGSPDALLQMTKLFVAQSPCRLDFVTELGRASGNDSVFHEIEQGLTAPTVIVTPEYLDLLSRMSVSRDHPEFRSAEEGKLAAAPYVDPDRPNSKQSLLRAEEMRYAVLLTSALPSKDPDARAQCLYTLLFFAQGNPQFPADSLAALRRETPDSFGRFGNGTQENSLRMVWPTMASPAMIPVLITLAGTSGSLRDLALQRLYQIAPQEAGEIILRNLRQDEPDFSTRDLEMLPDVTLPQFDASLLQRVQKTIRTPGGRRKQATELLLRYATPGITPQVQQLMEDNFTAMDCGPLLDLMAFVERTRPEAVDRMISKLQQGPQTAPCTLSQIAQRLGASDSKR